MKTQTSSPPSPLKVKAVLAKKIYMNLSTCPICNQPITKPKSMKNEEPKESWEKQFDEDFPPGYFFRGSDRNPIKSFISSLLKKEREEVIEEVEKLRKSEHGDLDKPFYGTLAARRFVRSYNQAIDETLSILRKER